MKERPDSPLSRSMRLGRLGLGVAGSYIGYQLQNIFLSSEKREERKQKFHKSASHKVRKELETLKGPMMKLGQILSMQSQALPAEAIRELSHLQMRAPGMHPSLASAQFNASFGKRPEEVFKHFEPDPFAAASLGQVHRATTKSGEAVAVKIQYPAIRTAIENDFKVLRSATFPGKIAGYVPDGLMKEVERGFLEETDYVHEARNVEWFGERLKPLSYVTLPRIHRELSTDRVLTMSFLKGVPLTQFVESNPSQAMRNLVGERVLELFHFQRLVVHAINADPHAGNFLIGDHGEIGLVDFGCVKKFTNEFVELVWAFTRRDWHTEKARARIMKILWDSRAVGRKAQGEAILDNAIVFSNFIYPQQGGKTIDFGDRKVMNSYTRMLNDATMNKVGNSEWAFHVRAELGYYNLLHFLRAKVNTIEVLDRVKELAKNHAFAKEGK